MLIRICGSNSELCEFKKNEEGNPKILSLESRSFQTKIAVGPIGGNII